MCHAAFEGGGFFYVFCWEKPVPPSNPSPGLFCYVINIIDIIIVTIPFINNIHIIIIIIIISLLLVLIINIIIIIFCSYY